MAETRTTDSNDDIFPAVVQKKGTRKEMLDQSVKLRLIEWQRSLAASLPSRWLMVFDDFVWVENWRVVP